SAPPPVGSGGARVTPTRPRSPARRLGSRTRIRRPREPPGRRFTPAAPPRAVGSARGEQSLSPPARRGLGRVGVRRPRGGVLRAPGRPLPPPRLSRRRGGRGHLHRPPARTGRAVTGGGPLRRQAVSEAVPRLQLAHHSERPRRRVEPDDERAPRPAGATA